MGVSEIRLIRDRIGSRIVQIVQAMGHPGAVQLLRFPVRPPALAA